MKDFGVYRGVQASQADARYGRDALPIMWVKRPKGAEVCCRLVCNGCYQETLDKGDTDSSTPPLISLKLFLSIGLTNMYSFNIYASAIPSSTPSSRERSKYDPLSNSTLVAAFSGHCAGLCMD